MGEAKLMKVVDELGLYTATVEGWEIEATRESDRVESYPAQVPVVMPGQHSGSLPYVQTTSVMAQRVVRSLRFVMSKATDSELAKRADEIHQLKLTLQEREQEVQKSAKALKEKAEELARSQEYKQMWEKTAQTSGEEVKKKQKLLHQYEADMAKVRAEVGEATMRRILDR